LRFISRDIRLSEPLLPLSNYLDGFRQTAFGVIYVSEYITLDGYRNVELRKPRHKTLEIAKKRRV